MFYNSIIAYAKMSSKIKFAYLWNSSRYIMAPTLMPAGLNEQIHFAFFYILVNICTDFMLGTRWWSTSGETQNYDIRDELYATYHKYSYSQLVIFLQYKQPISNKLIQFAKITPKFISMINSISCPWFPNCKRCFLHSLPIPHLSKLARSCERLRPSDQLAQEINNTTIQE